MWLLIRSWSKVSQPSGIWPGYRELRPGQCLYQKDCSRGHLNGHLVYPLPNQSTVCSWWNMICTCMYQFDFNILISSVNVIYVVCFCLIVHNIECVPLCIALYFVVLRWGASITYPPVIKLNCNLDMKSYRRIILSFPKKKTAIFLLKSWVIITL